MSATDVNDFKSQGGSHLVVTPSGKMLQTNPNDTLVGSTKVNDFTSGPAGSMPLQDMAPLQREVSDMKKEIHQLRTDMSGYFGVGGTVAKAVGSSVGTTLHTTLRNR